MTSAWPRVILGMMVLGVSGWLGLALFQPKEEAAIVTRWTSSQDCRPCHEEAFAEWEDSWHAKSFIDPDVREQSRDFANTDCIDCHAPKEVFLTGVGKRVLPRADRRVEGVDCIACHLLPSGDVAGTIDDPSAACRPVATRELQREEYCGVCHNQHKTVDQWRESHFAADAVGCIDCHMPFRDGDANRGRHHGMVGGHDIELVRSGVTLEARREGGTVVVEVENVGVGHAYPTDERSRASDLWWRPVGSEDWHHLHRIRDPYRHETDLPRTLLDAGERRALVIDDPGSEPIEVMLVYKLAPYYRLPGTGDPVPMADVIDPLTDSQEVHRVTVQ